MDATLTPPRTQYGATRGKAEKSSRVRYGGFASPCKSSNELIIIRNEQISHLSLLQGMYCNPYCNRDVKVQYAADIVSVRRRQKCRNTIVLPDMPVHNEVGICRLGAFFLPELSSCRCAVVGAIWHMSSGPEKSSKIRQVADVDGPMRC